MKIKLHSIEDGGVGGTALVVHQKRKYRKSPAPACSKGNMLPVTPATKEPHTHTHTRLYVMRGQGTSFERGCPLCIRKPLMSPTRRQPTLSTDTRKSTRTKRQRPVMVGAQAMTVTSAYVSVRVKDRIQRSSSMSFSDEEWPGTNPWNCPLPSPLLLWNLKNERGSMGNVQHLPPFPVCCDGAETLAGRLGLCVSLQPWLTGNSRSRAGLDLGEIIKGYARVNFRSVPTETVKLRTVSPCKAGKKL